MSGNKNRWDAIVSVLAATCAALFLHLLICDVRAEASAWALAADVLGLLWHWFLAGFYCDKWMKGEKA